MATFLLVALFAITMCIESIAYAFYEINTIKNKTGGIVIITFSILVVIFANVMIWRY